MRTVLAIALSIACLSTLLPVAAASDPLAEIISIEGPVATIACPVNTGIVSVCQTSPQPGCTEVEVTLYGQTVRVYQVVRGVSVTTPRVDVGPVHVDPIHAHTDNVVVGPYYVYTPGRSVSDTLCTQEASSVVAPFLPAISS